MAMMAKMRSLAPWFIITVGGLFVLFMVLSDSRIFEFLGQSRNNVGSINGYDVSAQEYSNLVERYRNQQKQQSGQDVDESQMDAFRDQVWDALVTQKLIEQKMNEFNISVTDEEIKDIILGPNPPDYLKQNFIDSTGKFNRDLYEQALFDPRNKEALVMAEDGVRQQRMQEKLQNYLNASIIVSEDEIKRSFADRSINMSIQYAVVDANSFKDKDFNPSEAELKDFYNETIENYKVDPQRKLKYVLFRKAPSRGDSTLIKNNLIAIVEKLKGDTSSFKTYVEIYSEEPYSKDTLSMAVVPAEARQLFAGAVPGQILGPVLTFQGYVVYKLDSKISSGETTVRASHILVRSDKGEDAAKAEADKLYGQLMGGADFAKLAKDKSEDPGSAVNGGDLGYFGKGQMVPEFEKACFDGRIGEIQKPVKTNYGYHIIKVTDKTSSKYIVEKISQKIQPSATTIDKLYSDANDFSYVAEKYGFENEAKNMKYSVMETPPFKEDSKSVPGLGVNQALVRFAFDNKVGTISTVFKVPAGYVVAVVSDIIKAGFKPYEEVAPAVKQAYLREKKAEKAKSVALDVRKKLKDGSDLREVLAFNQTFKVDSANNFTAAGSVPGIGRDFAVIDYSLEGAVNKISEPVKGIRGSYLIKVTRRTDFDSTAYSLQRNILRDQLLQQKRNQFFSQWIADLKENADIVDNRYLFYR